MVDDLKALRDEIARKLESVTSHRRNRPGLEDLDAWVTRLTSIIERNEKERAGERNALYTFQTEWPIVRRMLPHTSKMMVGPEAQAIDRLDREHRALTERAKP